MRDALGALTVRGRGFLAAGLTTTVCSILLGYDALMRVGVLAAALPLLTVWLVTRSRYRLMAQRSVAPRRIAVGVDAQVHLHLVNDGRLPTGTLLFEDAVPYALGRPSRFTVEQMGHRWSQDLTYRVRSVLRGRYQLGPLTVRVSDPFGLVSLRRSFSIMTELVVTPAVVSLPATSLTGEWVGTGERRPRAFSAGSAEDVTVREYRQGDDLRRVHWRSSAHTGELMVRREEQPWQSRATVVLDTRASAHRGTGSESSLEWSVTAAASVAVHLGRSGFAVRLLTDRPHDDGIGWHDRGADDMDQSAFMLDELAVVEPSSQRDLEHVATSLSAQSGLVVAVLGASTADDLSELARRAPRDSRCLLALLDHGAWSGDAAASEEVHAQASLMRRMGWQTVVVPPAAPLVEVWRRLGVSSTRTTSGGMAS